MNNEISSGAQPFAGAETSAANSREEAASSQAQVAPESAKSNGTQTDERDKGALFNKLISGEYKEQYQSALENALSKRLKTSNKRLAENEEFKTRLQPVFEILADKYSIEDSSDVDAIISAAENELLPDNERIELEFRERFEGWLREAEETKRTYPNFDFEYESSNPQTGEAFRNLLNSGVDVETAFTVIHRNEIMGSAMQYAYKTAKQEMADSRTSRLSRPSENGTSSHQSSAIIDDITKLKPAERRKIKAAVSRGEKVSAENFRRFL